MIRGKRNKQRFEVIEPGRLVPERVDDTPADAVPAHTRIDLEAFAEQGCPWGECEHDEDQECPVHMVDACRECSDAVPLVGDDLETIVPWHEAEARGHGGIAPTSWRDNQGDVWTLGDDGLLHAYETRPFPREYVERKWGPLTPVAESGGIGEGSDA